jgi:hypothetical protein
MSASGWDETKTSNAEAPGSRIVNRPPPDIFDLPPPEPRLTEQPAASSSAARRTSPRGHGVVGAASALLLASIVFRFPIPLCLGFGAAGVVCQSARPHNWLYRSLWAVILAAFGAQVTSIFVTPFTFPLRFVFFFVLIGLLVGYVGSQLDEM